MQKRFGDLFRLPSNVFKKITLGEAFFDLDRKNIIIGEISIHLSPFENELLLLLLDDNFEYVSRELINVRVQNNIKSKSSRSAEMLIARLRKKLIGTGVDIFVKYRDGYYLDIVSEN